MRGRGFSVTGRVRETHSWVWGGAVALGMIATILIFAGCTIGLRERALRL
jgi:hypothetical protein